MPDGVDSLRRLADRVADVGADALNAAAVDVVRIANRAAPPFTHTGRAGSTRLVAHATPATARAGVAAVRVTGTPPGFWTIATYGTRRHEIGRAGRRRRFTFGPGQAAWGPFTHRGARGTGVWDDVLEQAPPVVFDAFDDALDEALR